VPFEREFRTIGRYFAGNHDELPAVIQLFFFITRTEDGTRSLELYMEFFEWRVSIIVELG
jgi:hypothetical protein